MNKTVEQLNKCKVCSCHFNRNEYQVKGQRFISNSRAIPTVKIPDKPLSDQQMISRKPIIFPRLVTVGQLIEANSLNYTFLD